MSPVRGYSQPSLSAAESSNTRFVFLAQADLPCSQYPKHIVWGKGADSTDWCNPVSAPELAQPTAPPCWAGSLGALHPRLWAGDPLQMALSARQRQTPPGNPNSSALWQRGDVSTKAPAALGCCLPDGPRLMSRAGQIPVTTGDGGTFPVWRIPEGSAYGGSAGSIGWAKVPSLTAQVNSMLFWRHLGQPTTAKILQMSHLFTEMQNGKGPHGFFHSLNIYIKLLASFNILIILHENTWMPVGLIFLISYFKCELFGVNDSIYGLRRDVLFHVLVKDRQNNWTSLLNLEKFAKGVHGWMGAGSILSNSSDHSLIKEAPHEAFKSSILSSNFTKLSEYVE